MKWTEYKALLIKLGEDFFDNSPVLSFDKKKFFLIFFFFFFLLRRNFYKWKLMLQMILPLLSLSLLVSSSSATATDLTDAMSESIPFSSALTSAKRFLSIWIDKDFWRQQDLNPQPSNLIHDKLDHRTTVSCSHFWSLISPEMRTLNLPVV